MFHELAINCRNFSFSKKGRSNCAGRRISIRKGGEAMGSLARSVVTCAYDANGNITEYVGMDGTILSHNDYSAFGRELIKTGSDDFTHRFSTKPLCRKMGVLEYQLRKYRPWCGRWINRDAIEEEGGLNLYCMLYNNTIPKYDNLGQEWSDYVPVVNTLNTLFDFLLGNISGTNIGDYPTIDKRMCECNRVEAEEMCKKNVADFADMFTRDFLSSLGRGKGAEASIALISRLVNPYVASALAIDSLAGGGLALFISSQIMDALNEAVKACSCD